MTQRPSFVLRVSISGNLALAFLALAFSALPAVAGPAAVCGDGVIESGEQCDDGGVLALDGCDPQCLYEHVHRFTTFALENGVAPGSCTPATNAFGGAFSGTGLGAVNDVIAQQISGGELTILLDLLGLEDGAGMSAPSLDAGLLSAVADPESPGSGLDAWFLADSSGLGPDGLPAEVLTGGSITAGEAVFGPGDLSLPFLGGELSILAARGLAQVGASVSTPAPPPGALAAGFMAFETLDGSGSSHGLCGNVTVGSLALLPVPAELTSGITACQTCSGSRTYVACGEGQPVDASCHSLLDLLVGGCRSLGCVVNLITPTQPDVGVGAGSPNVLAFADSGGGIEKVTVVETDDAYSSWMTFTTERVHATNNLGVVFGDGFESGGTGAWSTSVGE